jgi:hypothetical protein
MNMRRAALLAAFAGMTLLLMAPSAQCATFDLQFDRLAAAVTNLNSDDRHAVDEAIQLIKKGDDNLALVRLNALNDRYPTNSSLRILTAYALLELGNMVGAFDNAKMGEAAPDGNSYKCWFYAKVAWLSGKDAVCKREIGHLKKVGDMPNEVRALEVDVQKKPKL